MKRFLLLIFIIVLTSSVLGVTNISNSDASTTELAVAQLYDCTAYDMNGAGTYQAIKLNSVFGNYDFLSHILKNRVTDCRDAMKTVELSASSNNITDTYSEYSARQIDQLGLDEFIYIKEKEQVIVNINTAWAYVHLLFAIFIELIMIFYYVLELYLVVYLLFIALPKAFLKLRDGISIFLVRRKKNNDKTQYRETTVNYNYNYKDRSNKKRWWR